MVEQSKEIITYTVRVKMTFTMNMEEVRFSGELVSATRLKDVMDN